MMDRRWIAACWLATSLLAGSAQAQYVERWSIPFPDLGAAPGTLVFCDVGRTQPGTTRSLLFAIPSQNNLPGFSGLRLIDGATGTVVWSFDEPPLNSATIAPAASPLSITGGFVGTPALYAQYTYPWKGGPQLLDVDGDGLDEIVFLDGSSQASLTLHAIQFGGAAASVGATADYSETIGLSQSKPNPSRAQVRIEYELVRTGHVELSVFSVQGQLVRILVDQDQTAGRYTAAWDGTDASGKLVPSGTYFYAVRTPLGEQSRKAIIIR